MTQALASIVVILLAMAPVAFSQSLSSLTGTVTDPSGAVVPNATLRLENATTGWSRTTTTDASGRYLFAQAPPGTYKVTASTPGFNQVAIERVKLEVNVPSTLNIEFKTVGEVTTVVSVVSEGAQLNTTDATIGNVIGTTAILQLPLFARNPANLLALQPGVTQFGYHGNEDINGAVNGGRVDQANVTLDGVDVNDQMNRSPFTSVLRVTLDSVQEFRSTTANPNADQGRSSGAQVSLVTKSGSNQLHGALYEFHRNTVTAANDFFNNRAGVPRPKLLVNVFGGAIGGPVVKNRLFYFFNFEGRRDASESTPVRTVPTMSYRQGTIQYLNRSGGVSSMGPAEIRAIDRLGLGVNQEVLRLWQQYPEPNDTTVGDGLNLSGYRFVTPTKGRENTYITRWDFAIDRNSSHNLFLRGNLQNDRYTGTPQFPGLPPNSVSLNNSKGLAIGYNGVLRPNLIAVTRYGFTRQGLESTGLQDRAMVSFRNITSLVPQSRMGVRFVPTHTFSEDVTWTKSAHTVQFGFITRILSIRRTTNENSISEVNVDSTDMQDRGFYENQAVPTLNPTFSGAFGDAITNIMGVITSGMARYNFDIARNRLPEAAPISRSFNAEEYELYVQDTWRVNRNLSLVGGLRYSLMPPFYEANGQQISALPQLNAFFHQRAALANAGIPTRETGLITYVPRDDPKGSPLYPFHKKNFAPRLSIAYSPSPSSGWQRWLLGGPGKTSIRAGWGMLYDLFGSGLMRRADDRAPGFSFRLFTPGTSFSSVTAPRFTGLFNIPSNFLPAAPSPTWPVTLPAGSGETTTGLPNDRLLPPYSMNMNFSISREYSGGWFVQAAYVGRLSRRSLSMVDLAQPVDFRDPVSGQRYTEGVAEMVRQVKAGIPVAQVQPIPWFENVFSNAAIGGLTPTQYLFQNVYRGRAPARWMGIFPLDTACSPVCSKYGRFTFFHPQYYSLGMWDNVGNGNYHGMQWTVRKRMGNRATADFNYTWSKSIDLTSRPERADLVYGATLIINSWEPRQMRAVSNYDARHMINANWVYVLPIGRGEKLLGGANRIVDALVGGWQVAGIYFFSTGLPYSVNNGFYPTNYNVPTFATPVGKVPDTQTTRNAPAISGPSGPNMFADPAAARAAYDFTIPGQTGQRNGLRGDKYMNLDFSLAKRFVMPYAETHSIQFRTEVLNFTNSAYFGAPSLSLDSPGSFGRFSYTRSTPRQIQFGIRYEF
jgi:hypothetical protein